MVSDVITDIAAQLEINHPSPLEKIDKNTFSHDNLWVKRDDLLHPVISGNKWRKLQFILANSIANKKQHLLSFGGGYSNHLHALAYACSKLQLKCTCLVRGNYAANPTPMLEDIMEWGCDIVYMKKVDYAKRYDAEFIEQIKNWYAADIVIPEGGSNREGILGVASIVEELKSQRIPDVIILPVGSAGTLAGLIKAIQEAKWQTRIIGVSVLKAEGSHQKQLSELFPLSIKMNNWKILENYHHGGYAKQSEQLNAFIASKEPKLGFSIDPVYNAKSFYALNQLISTTAGLLHSSVVIIQTGGNQGSRVKKLKNS